MKKCIISWCTSTQKSSAGHCAMHYRRARLGQDMDSPKKRTKPGGQCSVEKCNRVSVYTGMCQPHWKHMRKYGETREIKTFNPGEWGPWHIDKDGYSRRSRRLNGRAEVQLEHRHVMEEHIGRKLSPDETVHHRNTNRQDNNLSNLELWVNGHPRGGRVEEVLEWAKTIVERYS